MRKQEAHAGTQVHACAQRERERERDRDRDIEIERAHLEQQ